MKFWEQSWTGTDRVRQYVLDGQQRLQALYIALLGTYDGQQVYLDLLPQDDDRPSDLIFSVVAAEWKGVRPLLEDFLDELNPRGNFRFSTDDLLRISLVLTGKGAAYNLQHFRGNDARANVAAIKDAWSSMSETIRWVADFVRGDAQLKSDHLLVSYNALLPLVAYVHHRDLSRVGLADKNAMLALPSSPRAAIWRRSGDDGQPMCECHPRIVYDNIPRAGLVQGIRVGR
jgi:hypothetical protein